MSAASDFFDKLGMDIVRRTYEHVHLSVMAIAIGIALPLGIYLTRCRRPRLVAAVLGLAAVVQTVPSLALVSFIAILFTLIHLPLIGEPPALVALVLYALLPILRNAYTGIRQVDTAVVEVAKGLGMRPRQILFSVELPLSLPVIMAGIRISTVWTIGVATLCTLIGAGGLGVLIMRGLRSIQLDYLVAGTVPAALLAILFDGILARLERWLTPEGRKPGGMPLRTRLWLVLGSVLAMGVLLIGMRVFFTVRAAGGFGPGSATSDANESIRAAFDAEFFTRPDGYPAVCRHYSFSFPRRRRQMDSGLMYKAVADGTVDVICAFATDGRIPAYDLVVLEDDKHFFPPYDAAPLVRQATLARHPGLADVLNRLAGRLSDAKMQKLNFAADEEGKKAAVIAREFLLDEGLLAPADRLVAEPIDTITIGSKPFTEQEVLAEIMATLVEAKMPLQVRRVLNLGGTKLCFDALKSGDLDCYAEYTGTGLVSILGRPVIADSEESYRVVKKVFEDEFDLIWLRPFGFNNTYTLTMRRDQAERLGLTSISDLARYLNGR